MARRPTKPESETAEGTETERDALHPRHTPVLYGHDEAEKTFLRAFNAGALHHAWLLTGEAGIGKATFAFRAARFLLSREESAGAGGPEAQTLAVPPEHAAARQMAAGAHPSLFVLSSSGGASASIGVDDVRRVRAFLGLTSTVPWRAVIVDAANDLTVSSANALLKGIEEPPPCTVFFLVSQGASSVLPTIRSRCVRLALHPLAAADFKSAVLRACEAAALPPPDESALAKLEASASGSPGRALALLASGALALSDKLGRILSLLPKFDRLAAHDLIRSVTGSKNSDAFAQLCDLIEEGIEAKARAAAGAGRERSAAAWAGLWSKFREQRLDLESLNLDKGAFLTAAFSDMENAARESALASSA